MQSIKWCSHFSMACKYLKQSLKKRGKWLFSKPEKERTWSRPALNSLDVTRLVQKTCNIFGLHAPMFLLSWTYFRFHNRFEYYLTQIALHNPLTTRIKPLFLPPRGSRRTSLDSALKTLCSNPTIIVSLCDLPRCSHNELIIWVFDLSKF